MSTLDPQPDPLPATGDVWAAVEALQKQVAQLTRDVEVLGKLASDPRVVLLCDRCQGNIPRARFAGHESTWIDGVTELPARRCPGGVGDA